MKEIFFNTIQEFNDFIGVKTLHPLVSIARVESTTPIQEAMHHYGLYALFLKENKGCKLSYGRTEYDFDEMVKTETGQTAKSLINERLLSAARQLLVDETLSITQISQRLGFEYPQHFVRFFKAQTGKTPSEYRKTA